MEILIGLFLLAMMVVGVAVLAVPVWYLLTRDSSQRSQQRKYAQQLEQCFNGAHSVTWELSYATATPSFSQVTEDAQQRGYVLQSMTATRRGYVLLFRKAATASA